MNSAACPPADELSGFAIGNLPAARFTQLAEHVERCVACAATLEKLDGLADPLLVQLRGAAQTGLATYDYVPEELVAVARSARQKRAPSSWLPVAGRRLGKFELLEQLGIGSFGYVFRARDTELDRTVAIKVLRADRLATHDDVDRFLREARSAAQLKHRGIVSLYETGQAEDGTCYLVEEFVSGTTLARRLSTGRLDSRLAAELVAEVAEALEYAHQRGVIHRDIKPSNIMLDPEGRPHLMDFGLAKRETDEDPVTLDGQVLGTPAYMSPEQARGESHYVDARSDIYSLGVVLYELLTGERPFQGNRRMLLLQVLEDEPRPPRQLIDKLPRDLETICLKAMAKAPSRRYASARELADDLQRYLNGEAIKARPVGRVERLWRWCRRNPVAASLLIAVSLGSAFGLVYLSLLSKQLVRLTALESAAQQAEMLEHVNDHYSSIVDGVKRQGFELTDDPRAKGQGRGVVDLEVPAKFTIKLGMRMSQCGESGMQVRLFSQYPFRSRTDGGPQDDFEAHALEALNGNPDQPVHRFEEFQGIPVVRYAIARRMKASCIECHNNHPDSVKTDWREGDFRGVVEIIRPLDKDTARVREGLRGTFILMAVIFGSLLGLSVLVLVVGNRGRGRAREDNGTRTLSVK